MLESFRDDGQFVQIEDVSDEASVVDSACPLKSCFTDTLGRKLVSWTIMGQVGRCEDDGVVAITLEGSTDCLPDLRGIGGHGNDDRKQLCVGENCLDEWNLHLDRVFGFVGVGIVHDEIGVTHDAVGEAIIDGDRTERRFPPSGWEERGCGPAWVVGGSEKDNNVWVWFVLCGATVFDGFEDAGSHASAANPASMWENATNDMSGEVWRCGGFVETGCDRPDASVGGVGIELTSNYRIADHHDGGQDTARLSGQPVMSGCNPTRRYSVLVVDASRAVSSLTNFERGQTSSAPAFRAASARSVRTWA